MHTYIYVCVYTHTSPLAMQGHGEFNTGKDLCQGCPQRKSKQSIFLNSSVNWREGTETGVLIRFKKESIFTALFQFDILQT